VAGEGKKEEENAIEFTNYHSASPIEGEVKLFLQDFFVGRRGDSATLNGRKASQRGLKNTYIVFLPTII
jgi:hypothetical protein